MRRDAPKFNEIQLAIVKGDVRCPILFRYIVLVVS